ncbi:hypothetical protein BofuT4_P157860.1 [Botrytis cinerea T4]|uniref:Uncharacterized protein n=1 Tax=Botryotinia fuckeliana (strain T4) TaxID=999810 RepID=G2YUU2_BOTF4|nr:hypothetical protein BofuT4_P157860.1 [Botrytis cinerea T4]
MFIADHNYSTRYGGSDRKTWTGESLTGESATHKHTGKNRSMEMLLVVPPHGNFDCYLKSLPISELDDLSSHDASALHEAGISNLEHIIVLPFDLQFEGFVVRKERESATILPSNSASSTLMQKLKVFICYKEL